MTATSCTVDWVPTRLVFFECDMYRHRELCLWQRARPWSFRMHGVASREWNGPQYAVEPGSVMLFQVSTRHRKGDISDATYRRGTHHPHGARRRRHLRRLRRPHRSVDSSDSVGNGSGGRGAASAAAGRSAAAAEAAAAVHESWRWWTCIKHCSEFQEKSINSENLT